MLYHVTIKDCTFRRVAIEAESFEDMLAQAEALTVEEQEAGKLVDSEWAVVEYYEDVPPGEIPNVKYIS